MHISTKSCVKILLQIDEYLMTMVRDGLQLHIQRYSIIVE